MTFETSFQEHITRLHYNMEKRKKRVARDEWLLQEISKRTKIEPVKKTYKLVQMDLFGT